MSVSQMVGCPGCAHQTSCQGNAYRHFAFLTKSCRTIWINSQEAFNDGQLNDFWAKVIEPILVPHLLVIRHFASRHAIINRSKLLSCRLNVPSTKCLLAKWQVMIVLIKYHVGQMSLGQMIFWPKDRRPKWFSDATIKIKEASALCITILNMTTLGITEKHATLSIMILNVECC
jgi:hypothetical protein